LRFNNKVWAVSQVIHATSIDIHTINSRPEHFSGRAGFGPGRKKIMLFQAEKILPMTIPLDASGLNFRDGLGLGSGRARAWAGLLRIL
jgi:hypothetical protein